jgi:hypothetical protein
MDYQSIYASLIGIAFVVAYWRMTTHNKGDY